MIPIATLLRILRLASAVLPLIGQGVRVWRAVRPVHRLRVRRENRRRARRGLPALPEETEVKLPENVMRKGGVALLAAGPVLGLVLKALGVGAECTPQEVEMGCVTAGEISAALLTVLGGAGYWIGRNRAHARETGQTTSGAGRTAPTDAGD